MLLLRIENIHKRPPLFMLFFGERFVESGSFLAQNHLHPKGNYPSKFQLVRVSRYGGDCEQTNTHTHTQRERLTDILLLYRIDM